MYNGQIPRPLSHATFYNPTILSRPLKTSEQILHYRPRIYAEYERFARRVFYVSKSFFFRRRRHFSYVRNDNFVKTFTYDIIVTFRSPTA